MNWPVFILHFFTRVPLRIVVCTEQDILQLKNKFNYLVLSDLKVIAISVLQFLGTYQPIYRPIKIVSVIKKYCSANIMCYICRSDLISIFCDVPLIKHIKNEFLTCN